MSQSSEKRALDLVIDGHDISHYIGDWATCQETSTTAAHPPKWNFQPVG